MTKPPMELDEAIKWTKSMMRFEFTFHALNKSKDIEALSVLIAECEKRNDRPKITCFCGSGRFIAEMAILMWEYEKAGHIALGLHLMPEWYGVQKGYCKPGEGFHHLAELEGCADQMDELHKRKIDLADEIFVVNSGGYIGSSTRSEIEYATKHGKRIIYLESIPQEPK